MFQNTRTPVSAFRFVITVFLVGWAVASYSTSSPAQNIATADNHQSYPLKRASPGMDALFWMPDVFACCLKLKTQVTEVLSSTSNHLNAVQIRIKSSHFGPLLVYEMLPVSHEVGRSPSPDISLVGLKQTGEKTMPVNVVNVSSAEQLLQALSVASGETEIILQAGDYGHLDLYDARDAFAKFSDEVTIRSADANDPATITSMSLNGVENLTFDSIKFDYDAAPGSPDYEKPFLIKNSSDIKIKNSTFDGDTAEGVSDILDGYGTGHALTVQKSSGILVENNEFYNFMRAGVFGSVDGLIVKGNEVHNIRSDGFNFADVDNVLIEGNYIHDFVKSPLSGDHMDMIQFWTSGTSSPSTNVIIRNNILDSGEGSETQSIFIRNQVVDLQGGGLDMYYQNFTIENNVIYNAHSHGITVGETDGLIISNNTILHNRDSGVGELVFVPTIYVTNASVDVTVTDNIVSRWSLDPPDEWTVSGNLAVQTEDPDAADFVGNLFVNALAGSDAELTDLMALPGGLIEQMGVGADLTKFDVPDGGYAGYVAGSAGDGFLSNTRSFDASNLYNENGKIDVSGATISWDFGDGATGSGLGATHAYEGAGLYDVVATIELPSGETVLMRNTVPVEHPLLVKSDFDAGALDQSSTAHEIVLGSGVTFEEGLSGQAIRLNGDEVTYKKSPGMIGNSEYTVLLDFKKDPGSEESGGRVLNFSGSFVVILKSDGIDVAISTDQGDKWIQTNTIGINDADWHRIALTFSSEAGAAILYLDGVEVGRIAGLEGAIQTGMISHDLHLGDPWGEGFSGLIDNFHFYSAAMSAEQVGELSSPDQHGAIDFETETEWAAGDPDLIEDNGARQLGISDDGAYQINNGGDAPVILKVGTTPVGPATFAGWTALQAEASDAGFAVLWQDPNGGYAVWQTDAGGSYVSSYSLQASELVGLETLFAADLNDDGRIGAIEDNGAYQLTSTSDGAYQVSNGIDDPVILKVGTTSVGAATFAGWTALQTEASDAGFAVLWQDPNGDYAVWQTDAAGSYVSSYSLQASELAGLETLFVTDLDGDGAVGMIEDNGAYKLSATSDGAYQIGNGVDVPVILKVGTTPVGPATFAGWEALQAEASDAGFAVLWQDPDGGYAVWQTDAAGSYVSSYSLQESELVELENLFSEDLNGDDGIGVIEDNGACQLSFDATGAYQFNDGVAAPTVLKYDGVNVESTTFAGWSAVQAEATTTGFSVLWHHDSGNYIVWETDAAGNYQTSRNLPEAELSEVEIVFAADLDGDCRITIENNGAYRLSGNSTDAYQISNGVDAPVVLTVDSTEVGAATFAGWAALQAEAHDDGFAVLWQDPNDGYAVWQTDATGSYVSSYSLPESELAGLETLFATDLNGDGGLGLV